MSGPVLPWKTTRWFTATLLVCGLLCTTGAARAQTGAVGQSPPPAQSQDRTAGKAAKAAGKAAKADSKANTTRPGKAKDAQDQEKKMRSEPSVAYQESIRQTVERRRARRARREAQAGASGAVGGIVPWPMPPALIIRHTRDVHDDIGAFLFGLRY